MYIDAHCHLDLFDSITTKFKSEDLLPIKTITVTNSPSFFEPNKSLFSTSRNIRVALGLHPELSQNFQSQIEIFEYLIKSTRYIGEIGLDGSEDFRNFFKIQSEAFKAILKIVKQEGNKILTIHSRCATSEINELVKSYLEKTDSKIILHWYTGNKNDLNEAAKLGFYFSVNHRMVASKRGKELIQCIPTSKILTETDAPFTFDNTIKTRIQSLERTIKGIAAIKGIPEENMKELVYNNFKCLLT